MKRHNKILCLKSEITEMKISQQRFKKTFEQGKEIISELKNSPTEIIQYEEQKEKRMTKNEQSIRGL